MVPFKFFHSNKLKPLFQFEISNHIIRSSDSNMSWGFEYSDLIKKWISDLYFSDRWRIPNLYFKYFRSIDRLCEIIETPVIDSHDDGSTLLRVKIKIWATDRNWLIIHLSYPTEHIIYR